MNKECCDECWSPGAKLKDLHGPYFCINPSCPCHLPASDKEEWKEQLKHLLVEHNAFKIIAFVSQKIAKAQESGYELRDKEYASTVQGVFEKGRRQAIEEVVAKIEEIELYVKQQIPKPSIAPYDRGFKKALDITKTSILTLLTQEKQ